MNDERDTYIAAVSVADMFADPTYQRELDANRARSMAHQWQPRLVGVIDVADRGENATPRYAVINGQHRWKAATFVDESMSLVANIHCGLTVEEEAQLFWDIDRKTKKLTNWDRWYARRAAGDPAVRTIDKVADSLGMVVTHNPGEKHLQCCSALEWIFERGSADVIRDTLELVTDVWPGDREALKAPVLKGVAVLLDDYDTLISTGRVGDVLSEVTPTQLVARAHELKSRGYNGSLHKLVTTAIVIAYNRGTKQKLEVPA